MSSNYVTLAGSEETDGRWSHTFSQSFLGTFQHCPEQARAEYFREVEREDTDSTALGVAVHAGIEWALHEKRDRRDPDVRGAIEVAQHELDVIGEWKYTKFGRAKVYTLVEQAVGSFMAHVLPEVRPLLIEHKFKYLLYRGKHRDVYLSGTMDCVDEDWLPWDWKTGSQPYEPWEKQRWAFQPTVYTWATHQWGNDEALRTGYPDEIFEELPPDSLFRYAVMLHDGSVQILDVHRNQSHVDWMKEVCSQIAWMIEHGVNPWPYNDGGWWCSDKWCGKFAECKGRFMEDGWLKAP